MSGSRRFGAEDDVPERRSYPEASIRHALMVQEMVLSQPPLDTALGPAKVDAIVNRFISDKSGRHAREKNHP